MAMKRQKSVTVEAPNQREYSSVDEQINQKKAKTVHNARIERDRAINEGKIGDEFLACVNNTVNEYHDGIKEIRERTAKKFVDEAISILEKNWDGNGSY